jgi:ABC-type oligopeptide transport system ATPase subunit
MPTSPTGLGSCTPGRSSKKAPPSRSLSKPLHPYTQFLINSLPKFGDKNDARQRARQPALAGGPARRLPVPSPLPACDGNLPQKCRASPACRLNHKVACWLIGEGEWKSCLKLTTDQTILPGQPDRQDVLTAADQVSFYIKPAEIFTLAGESGCGKTTTAKVVLGLKKPPPG